MVKGSNSCFGLIDGCQHHSQNKNLIKKAAMREIMNLGVRRVNQKNSLSQLLGQYSKGEGVVATGPNSICGLSDGCQICGQNSNSTEKSCYEGNHNCGEIKGVNQQNSPLSTFLRVWQVGAGGSGPSFHL